MKKVLLLILLTVCFSASAVSPHKKPLPFITKEAEHWADSILSCLNPDERIAQLFMVAAWSNKDSVHIKEIEKLICDWGIGGLIFFQGGPVREALLTNYYQSISKVPLLIGMDAEWGLAMRIDSTIRFPRQMTLSATDDDSLVYFMGSEIARQCQRLGIHINFAPDADINNNPLNPIIGSRSFSDDREEVYRRSLMYMNALQDHHILSTAKHFPGHGNADTDSHLALPTIEQSKEQMDSMELYPFRKLIDDGLTGMMVAHLNVPALDSTPALPSTLSYKIVSGLLKEQLGFQGLIFTDALNMKGVSACYKPGILDKLAFMAGNDVMLYAEDVHKAIDEINQAVVNGEVTRSEIDRRAKKVLMAKYWCGLNHYSPIDTAHLYSDLNSSTTQLLQREMYKKSITLLKNEEELLPFRGNDTPHIASLAIGDNKINLFQKQLALYGINDFYYLEKEATSEIITATFNFLTNFDYVILSLHGTSMKAQNNYGISPQMAALVDSIIKMNKTVFVDFGNAYTLTRFKNLNAAKAILISYEDFTISHQLTAQMIMGGITANGKLPVQVNDSFKRKSGLQTKQVVRLEYAQSESVGIPSNDLTEIDSIIKEGINLHAMPGCQVMVVKSGKVIYNKAFGTKMYDADTVRTTDLYDIASITKIAATALSTMKLVENHKMDLNQPVSKYLSKLKGTNKKSLLIKDVLTHQSGLPSWLAFYKELIKDSSTRAFALHDSLSKEYPIRVAEKVFLHHHYKDSLQQWIYDAPLGEKGKYLYSDLGPILMKQAIEKITSKSFDSYLYDNFYKPLGVSITFQPLKKFSSAQIVPTENDTIFRKQILRGDVHDPAAALMDGVSGNAGLFSSANDLAVIMQMLLNGGEYGGKRYLKKETVDLFTGKAFPESRNRRGLLFDKPETEPGKPSPCSAFASPLSFGHQGFTGTCVWADPKYDLIYVFLSNRVFPDASNEIFGKLSIRTAVQDVIYKAIIKNSVTAQ